jgi:hypothetical protein
MKDVHMTAAVFERLARGDLADGELFDLLEHLEKCQSCARTGQARAAGDLSALRHELLTETQRPRPQAFVWLAAAAALIVIALLSAWIIRNERAPQPQQAPPMATRGNDVAPAPPPPAPVDVAYADPEWKRLVDTATASGRLPFPAELETLRTSPDIVRGSSGTIERISPAGVVIDEVRPTFTWPSRTNGTYSVSIFDGDREVTHSPSLQVARWKPDRDLPRGRTLAWQVEVTGHGSFETIPSPPSPPATFRIVTEDGQREIARVRSLHPDDHLLLAVLYAHNGMRAEALASLRRADDEVAKRILAHETSATR